MIRHLLLILPLLGALALPSATSAQTVTFETTVGDFDMVLNPTGNPLLDPYVDNLISYLDDYHCSFINRADTGFVLQMGSFYNNTLAPPTDMDQISTIETNDPVEGVPAAEIGLSNTTGTVALALPSDQFGPLQDEGTSSFFVNLGDNSILDNDFTVFAEIPDMSTIDAIMALPTANLTGQLGLPPNNLGFSDVPLNDGNLVFIADAFVSDPNPAVAMMAAEMAAEVNAELNVVEPELAVEAVPEPAAIVLLVMGLTFMSIPVVRRAIARQRVPARSR